MANKDTGTLYVHIDDRLHPVTDLTSARLIVGQPDLPVKVGAAEIAKYPSGSLVGIFGAPGDMQGNDDPWSLWTICDVVAPRSAAPAQLSG